VDGRALTGRFTGDRTYWRNLLRALLRLDSENQYLVYSRTPIPDSELPTAPNLTRRLLPAPNDRLWTLRTLPQALGQDRADVAHVQYTVPLFSPCPVVTTVHDISFQLYPQWFQWRDRILMNLTIPPSLRAAARILTDSESSRQDILRVYRLPPEKVVTTPLGLPEEFVVEAQASDPAARQETARRVAKERFGLEKPFLLAVGVLQPRKNLPMLVEAFGRAIAENHLEHAFAIVGKIGWGTGQETLRAAAAQGGGAKAAEALVFPGYVNDSDLPTLYRTCAAFAYPSLYEGFGLPPLEAMACSAPTLVSNAPPMPEVAGDAALILPATDVSAWATALAQVFRDPELRRDLAERGPARALRFRWEETARRTLEIYLEAAGKRSPRSSAGIQNSRQ
jgi:glycosyltransferase involved in cell wall biosynthesis